MLPLMLDFDRFRGNLSSISEMHSLILPWAYMTLLSSALLTAFCLLTSFSRRGKARIRPTNTQCAMLSPTEMDTEMDTDTQVHPHPPPPPPPPSLVQLHPRENVL